MSRAISSRQASSGNGRRTALWFGFLGGALAWTLHFFTAYLIAEFGCVGGLGGRAYRGVSLVAWAELLATGIAVSLAASATLVAWHTERQLLRRAPDEILPGGERYTARAGLLASGFFTLVIVFESIPIFFYLPDC